MVKFSVVIPTADRHYLLEHSLRSCLALDRDDIEVIVSDNFSSPETRAVVDAHRYDPRLRYFRTDRRMPMPEHWDFAWDKARGNYVIINCDDDALSASGLNVIERGIDDLGAQILSWPVGLYFHPDYETEGGANRLILPSGHSNLHFLLSSSAIISSYSKFDCRYFPSGTRFCIAKSLGDAIIRATGRLFWPPSPDFTAPLLALAAADHGRYCYIDSVLGFGGRSQESNAASFQTGATAEDAKRVKQFVSEFGESDLYPHHKLKINLYCNSHLAAISLLRAFYPERAPATVDMFKFFCSAYAELTGARPNFLLDSQALRQLDVYIASLEPDQRRLADDAKRCVMSQRGWRRFGSRNEFIRSIMPAFVKNGLKLLLMRMGRYQRTAAMRSISGAKYKFGNAHELWARWDQIVRENDLMSLDNIDMAFRHKLILSAHDLTQVIQDTPSRSVGNDRPGKAAT